MRNFKKRIVSFVSAIALAATILPGAELIASAEAADGKTLSLKNESNGGDFYNDSYENGKWIKDSLYGYQAGYLPNGHAQNKSDYQYDSGSYTFTLEVAITVDSTTPFEMPELQIGGTTLGQFPAAEFTEDMKDHPDYPRPEGKENYEYNSAGGFWVYRPTLTVEPGSGWKQLKLVFKGDKDKIGYKQISIAKGSGGGNSSQGESSSGASLDDSLSDTVINIALNDKQVTRGTFESGSTYLQVKGENDGWASAYIDFNVEEAGDYLLKVGYKQAYGDKWFEVRLGDSGSTTACFGYTQGAQWNEANGSVQYKQQRVTLTAGTHRIIFGGKPGSEYQAVSLTKYASGDSPASSSQGETSSQATPEYENALINNTIDFTKIYSQQNLSESGSGYIQFNDSSNWGKALYYFDIDTAGDYTLTVKYKGNGNALFQVSIDDAIQFGYTQGSEWLDGGSSWVNDEGTKTATISLTAGRHKIEFGGQKYAQLRTTTIVPVSEPDSSEPDPTTYTISTEANPPEGGTVTGSGSYASGSPVTLTATAKPGYTFTKWQKNGSDIADATSTTYNIASVAAADAGTYTAVFTALPTYTVTLPTVSNGTVTAKKTSDNSNVASGSTVPAGTEIAVTATADSGFEFTKWSDNSTTNSYTVTVNANYTALTPTFTAQSSGGVETFTITDFKNYGWNDNNYVEVNPSNYSSIKVIVEGCKDTVQVEAVNASGGSPKELINEKPPEGTSLEYTFTSADFERFTDVTRIRVKGSGNAPTSFRVVCTPIGGGQSDADYEVVGPYRSGTVSASGNTLTATPRSEFEFVGWYDNATCTGDALSTSLTYTSNGTKVYAKFDHVAYSLPIIDIVTKDSEGNSGASYSEAWLGGKTKDTTYEGSAITFSNTNPNWELPQVTTYQKGVAPYTETPEGSGVYKDAQGATVDKKGNLLDNEGNKIVVETHAMTAQVKGRGNSTWALEKKPFQLKFEEKVNPFNMGKEPDKTWILLANHGDRTLMRNQLAYTWAQELDGIPFTTDATPVEVYMNGDYIGMYIMVEKSRVGAGRVNIQETSTTTSDMAEIGFLAEWDKLAENKNGEPQEDYYIKTNVAGFSEFFTLHSGVYSTDENGEDHTTSGGINTNTTALAIGDYLNTVSAAIMSGDKDTIRSYVNMDSFVDMFILQEFTKNPDCGGSSFYMYKNKGANSKLTLGPAWDFDKAFGDEVRVQNPNTLYCVDGGDNGNDENVNTWFKKLYEQQWFKDLVVARWDELRSDSNKNPANLVDQITPFYTTNASSIDRQRTRWEYDMTHEFSDSVFWGDDGLTGTYFGNATTPALQQAGLKQWITDRIAFLDIEWSGNAVTIDAKDYNSLEFKYNDGGNQQPAIPFVVTNSNGNGNVTEHDIIVTINYTGSGKWVNVFTPVFGEGRELRDGFGGETATGADDRYGIANSFYDLTGGLTIQKHAIQQNGPFTFVIPAGSPTGTYLAGVSGADSFDSITVKYADDDGIQKYEEPVGDALGQAPIFKVNKDAYGYTSKARAEDNTYYVDEKVTAVAREGYMFVNWSIVTTDGHNESIVPIDKADGFTGVNARNKVLSLTAAMAGKTIYAIFAEKQSIRYEAENFVNLVSEGYVIPKQTLENQQNQGVPEEQWIKRKMTNAEFYGRTWDGHPTSRPYDDPKVVRDGENTSTYADGVKQVWDDTEYTTHKIVTRGYSGGKAVALTGPTSGVAIPFTVTEELLDDFTFKLGYNYGDMPTNYTNGGSHWYDYDVYVNVYATAELTSAQKNALIAKGWALSEYADINHASDTIIDDAKVGTEGGGLQTAFYKRLPIDSLNWKTHNGDDPRENVQETEVTLPAGLPVGKYYISVATDHANLFSDDAAGRKYESKNADSEGNYTGTGTVGTAYYDYIEFYTASTPDYPSPITVGANFKFVDMFGNSLMTNEFSQATFNPETSQIQFHPVVPRYLQVQGYKISYWTYEYDHHTYQIDVSQSASTADDTNEQFNDMARAIEEVAFPQGTTITFTAHYVVKNDVYDMTVDNGRVYVMQNVDDENPVLLPKGLVYQVSNYGMVKLVANGDPVRDGNFQYWTLNGQIYSYKREVIFSAWCNANFVAVYGDAEHEEATPAAFISGDVQQFGFDTTDRRYHKISFDCAFYIPDKNNFLSCGIIYSPYAANIRDEAFATSGLSVTNYGTFENMPEYTAVASAEYDQLFAKANHQVIISITGVKNDTDRSARAYYIYNDNGTPTVVFSSTIATVHTLKVTS